MGVNDIKKEELFRDSKKWYLNKVGYVSPQLIDFSVRHTGKKILDIGCATGEYCRKLTMLGFKCVGIDINPLYIAKQKGKGIEMQVMDATSLKFSDNSFDTALLFEVLEHANNPDAILKEAKRVSSKNVLITVPNCSDFFKLKKMGLTYGHMLEKDHINFFTKEDLENLLSKYFKKFKVEEKEPINLVFLPWRLRVPISFLHKLKIIKPITYFRLYAVAEVE
jgi:ubiquinone/menaquinone biosynthesis C-methylase UbiE